MKDPFEAYVDGKKIEKWFVHTDGNNLVARVLPKNEWPDELTKLKSVLEEPIYLHLFSTPISEYNSEQLKVPLIRNKKVNMGYFPTLIQYGQSEVKQELKKGFLYDLLLIGTYNGNRGIFTSGRLSTEKGKVPMLATLEELKLLAIEYLEMTPTQAQNIKARIESTIWTLNNGMKVNNAVFNFGKGNWVLVDYNGDVSHLFKTKKQIKEYIGTKH